MKKNLTSGLVFFVAASVLGLAEAAFAGISFTKHVRTPGTADRGAQAVSCSFSTSDNTALGYATITFVRVEEGQFAGRNLSFSSSVSERIFLPNIPLKEMLTSSDFLPLAKLPSDRPVSTYYIEFKGNYSTESNILLDEFSNAPKKNAAPGVDGIIKFIDKTCQI